MMWCPATSQDFFWWGHGLHVENSTCSAESLFKSIQMFSTSKRELTFELQNTSQKVTCPTDRDCNFQIICPIMKSIAEFKDTHLHTSFASIDPKVMKLHSAEGTYPRICVCIYPFKSQNSQMFSNNTIVKCCITEMLYVSIVLNPSKRFVKFVFLLFWKLFVYYLWFTTYTLH